VNEKTGEPMTFEILLVSPAFERIVLPFVHNLQRLGIDARVRLVDESQYINRLRSYDFDTAMLVWGQSESPGNEQSSYWGSAAADTPGTRNYAGVKDAVVDGLIEALITAPDRESLVARARALDRALLWGFYVIPAWHLSADRVLFWDKFGFPEPPEPIGAQLDTWWYDAARARQLEERVRSATTAGKD
jgi:microcin C transport system substrate-binding protein